MRRHIMTSLLLVAPGAALAAQDTTQVQYPPNTSSTTATAGIQAGPQDDRGLVMKMHRGHLMEIRAGQLAQQNGSSARVKEFGAQLVRDHQSADQELTRVAGLIGITLPHDMSHDKKAADSPMMPMPSQRRDTTISPPGNIPSERKDTMPGNPHPTSDQMDRAKTGDTAQAKMAAAVADTTNDERLIQRLSQLRGAEFDREFAQAMVQSHEKKLRMLEQAQGQIQRPELRTLVQTTIQAVRSHLQLAQSINRTITTSSIN
jgi:predicted outer membrane protein